MNQTDASKIIRQLLKIATPIQNLIDQFEEPLSGRLMELTGGSNSGKSKVSLSLIEFFMKQGRKISFFDIENNGIFSTKQHPDINKKELNLFTPTKEEELMNDLNAAVLLGIDVMIIDYINLINIINYSRVMSFIRELAMKHHIFVIVVTHDRSKRVVLDPAIEQNCHFKVEVSRSSDFKKIHMRILKNAMKQSDGPVISIVNE